MSAPLVRSNSSRSHGNNYLFEPSFQNPPFHADNPQPVSFSQDAARSHVRRKSQQIQKFHQQTSGITEKFNNLSTYDAQSRNPFNVGNPPTASSHSQFSTSANSNNQIPNYSVQASVQEKQKHSDHVKLVSLSSNFVWALIRDSFGVLVSSTATTSLSTAAPKQQPSDTIAEARFRKFAEEILKTTNLSPSVIFMALRYIALYTQLKNEGVNKFPGINLAEEGSEYTIFIVALVIANKTLEDNPYTNKTWSQVTKLEVDLITRHERELLTEFNFRLLLNEKDYKKWRDEVVRFVESYNAYRSSKLQTPQAVQLSKPNLQQPPLSAPPFQPQSILKNSPNRPSHRHSRSKANSATIDVKSIPYEHEDSNWEELVRQSQADTRRQLRHMYSASQIKSQSSVERSLSRSLPRKNTSVAPLPDFLTLQFPKSSDISLMDSQIVAPNVSNRRPITPRILKAVENGYEYLHGLEPQHDEEADHVDLFHPEQQSTKILSPEFTQKFNGLMIPGNMQQPQAPIFESPVDANDRGMVLPFYQPLKPVLAYGTPQSTSDYRPRTRSGSVFVDWLSYLEGQNHNSPQQYPQSQQQSIGINSSGLREDVGESEVMRIARNEMESAKRIVDENRGIIAGMFGGKRDRESVGYFV